MFEPMNFIANLGYMGTGMVAIFVVIGMIILVTNALSYVFMKLEERAKENNK